MKITKIVKSMKNTVKSTIENVMKERRNKAGRTGKKAAARITVRITAVFLLVSMLLVFTACGDTQSGTSELIPAEQLSSELTYAGSMQLSYASEFTVDYYEGGYSLISVMADESQFLMVPEGKNAPSDLSERITVLQEPLENIYLVASAAMDMYASIDALDSIGFSALEAESWYVEEAAEAMKKGEIKYAGKYSAPDYELILSGNCDLAFENMMIFHTPEIKEQLEGFGIPVIVDYSSNEQTPLGRMEWVKLCGTLTGKTAEAEAIFAEQEKLVNEVQAKERTDKTVAFFYITTNGGVNVRKSSDYLPKMIDIAGGKYIFDDLGDAESTGSSTMTMQMEDFYAAARDADYLIYNSTIDGELSSLEDFLDKSTLLEGFTAVKNGNVYCTGKNLYQSSMDLGTIMADISYMLSGEDEKMTYLYKLN